MSSTPTPASPTPEGAKVTELEQRLADAAAEVARVQAELSQARAADPNHPQVPVPYDGHAPVVMINGQQVPAGQAVDVSAMLGGMFAGTPTGAALEAAASTPGAQVVSIPPVISVNGQVYGAGQPVDLASVIGPEALTQVRSSLEQLGLGGFVGMLGGAAPAVLGSAAPPAAGTPTPGPAAAMPYASTPGEVSGGGGGTMLAWFAALLVLALIGVLVYLGLTN
jgi:hypothetical protein